MPLKQSRQPTQSLFNDRNVETMIAANSDALYDQGPGNETIEKAYVAIHAIGTGKSAASHARRDRADEAGILSALEFLLRGGVSPQHGTSFIDDTRCLLYALEVLEQAPSSFVHSYHNVWPAIGSLSAEILSRVGKTRVSFDEVGISERFGRKFSDGGMPWGIRAQIIDGFRLVAHLTKRTKTFWSTTKLFLEECQRASANPGSERNEINNAVKLLVNFWWDLARLFPAANDVRMQVVQNASPLLKLIRSAQLPQTRGIQLWYESLKILELPLLPKRGREIQNYLDETAKEIGEAQYNPNWWLREWFGRFGNKLMPYLHGREERPRHIQLPDYARRCATVLNLRGSSRRFDASIKDVCGRTLRGFCISIKDISLSTTYGGAVAIGDRVEALVTERQESIIVDDVELILQVNPGNDSGTFTLQCGVLRGWNLPNKEEGSGWVFRASESADIPESWRNFVGSIEK
jgi:hypothetical protein